MLFWIWEECPAYMRVIARRTAEQVKQMYHDMRLGEYRQINGVPGNGMAIQRVQ